MTYADSILPEFDMEMANTRKVLERIPDDRLDWQPHPKSHTIGWNANHVADLLNWLVQTLKTPSLDIAPVGGPPYALPQLASRKEILELFDRNVAEAQRHHRGHGPGRGQPVDFVTRGHADFHHAARSRDPGICPQPSNPPSCAPVRLSSTERHPRSGDVRTVGRRINGGSHSVSVCFPAAKQTDAHSLPLRTARVSSARITVSMRSALKRDRRETGTILTPSRTTSEPSR